MTLGSSFALPSKIKLMGKDIKSKKHVPPKRDSESPPSSSVSAGLSSSPVSASSEAGAVLAPRAGDIRSMAGKEMDDDTPSEDWDVLSGGSSLSMAAKMVG